jgi:hypothetical protein
VDAANGGRIPARLPTFLQIGMPRGRWLVSQQKPEDPEITPNFFGKWLLEASEAQLQEFVENAPQWLSIQPLALLRDFKALVDVRLAAEPRKKVTFASNPQDVRVSYWGEIANRLAAEINCRLGKSAEVGEELVHPKRHTAPDIAKRRAIVKANSSKSAQDLCRLFDLHNVPVIWDENLSWAEAYLNLKYRHSIQSLISRDRSAGEPV